MREINSQQNPHFKEWKSLLENKGIKKSSSCLVSGAKIVNELIEKNSPLIQALILSQGMSASHHNLSDITFLLNTELFKELDVLGTKTPLLVCHKPTLQEWNEEDTPKGLEVLCPIGDPNNLGALLRSAEAFDIQRVILLKEAANPFLPKVTRSSSGSNLRLQISTGPSIHELTQKTYALTTMGETIPQFQWPKNLYLLIGEEGPGVPKNLPIEPLTLPIHNTVESLNVSVASGIALYTYREQHPSRSTN